MNEINGFFRPNLLDEEAGLNAELVKACFERRFVVLEETGDGLVGDHDEVARMVLKPFSLMFFEHRQFFLQRLLFSGHRNPRVQVLHKDIIILQ